MAWGVTFTPRANTVRLSPSRVARVWFSHPTPKSGPACRRSAYDSVFTNPLSRPADSAVVVTVRIMAAQTRGIVSIRGSLSVQACLFPNLTLTRVLLLSLFFTSLKLMPKGHGMSCPYRLLTPHKTGAKITPNHSTENRLLYPGLVEFLSSLPRPSKGPPARLCQSQLRLNRYAGI
jgi:hypothetical protein